MENLKREFMRLGMVIPGIRVKLYVIFDTVEFSGADKIKGPAISNAGTHWQMPP